MDALGGLVGITTLISIDDKIVTIDMRVDYIRSARSTDLIIEARIVRSGNKIITTNMQVFTVKDNVLVAEGRGVYHVSRKRKRITNTILSRINKLRIRSAAEKESGICLSSASVFFPIHSIPIDQQRDGDQNKNIRIKRAIILHRLNKS